MKCGVPFSGRRPVDIFLRFGGAKCIFRGAIFLIFIYLKQIFLSTTKFGEAQKKFWVIAPECSYVATGPAGSKVD